MALDFDLSGIVLLTGVPGSGKTLRTLQIAERAVKENRPVFNCGINGMSLPGVQEWSDPHAWRDLPPRAVLLVDEAQDHFRTRPGTVRPPESITDMERIRHSGVCLVLTTQQPSYLDKHLRGLVGRHEHLVEVVAGKISNVYSWRSCREDITPSALGDSGYEAWAHPKHLHKFYKSAEVHTKKARLPLRLKVLLGFVVLFAGYLVYTYGIKDDAPAPVETASGAPAPRQSPDAGAPAPGQSKPKTPLEFAQWLTPRFPSMPQTAPAYDDRPVVAEPRVFCMASSPGLDGNGEWSDASVTCLTEQGTVYDLDTVTARHVARYGPAYDPYRKPEGQREAAPMPGTAPVPAAAVEGAPVAVSLAGDQVASYGAPTVGGGQP